MDGKSSSRYTKNKLDSAWLIGNASQSKNYSVGRDFILWIEGATTVV